VSKAGSATKIVSSLTSTQSKYKLLYELNTQQFVKLDWTFVPKKSSEDWFVYKLEQIKSPNITIDEPPVELFYGHLYTLKQDDKMVGMLINTPRMFHKTMHDFLITSPKNTKVDDLDDKAEVFLSTSSFSVFILDNTCQFIAASNPTIQSILN
jgi:hypothetical protein